MAVYAPPADLPIVVLPRPLTGPVRRFGDPA